MLKLTKDLNRKFCTAYFDKFFSRLILLEKPFGKKHLKYLNCAYKQKTIAKIAENKKMKKGNCEYLYSKNVMD